MLLLARKRHEAKYLLEPKLRIPATTKYDGASSATLAQVFSSLLLLCSENVINPLSNINTWTWALLKHAANLKNLINISQWQSMERVNACITSPLWLKLHQAVGYDNDILLKNITDFSFTGPRESLEIITIGSRQFVKEIKNVHCAGYATEPRICHSFLFFHTTLSILFPALRQMKYWVKYCRTPVRQVAHYPHHQQRGRKRNDHQGFWHEATPHPP